MKISFHGAARTVTGSKHLVHIQPDKKILLDCGMFQGMGRDTVRLNKEWGFEPKDVDYVILSHAHIDHIGLLPKLVKDGFIGRIFITPASADLANILMKDSARIQEADIAYINREREKEGRELLEPLYSEADVYNTIQLFEMVDYNTPFEIDEQVELLYTDCGHILGSAAVNLKIKEDGRMHRLTFSGDVGRYRDLILRSPQTFPQADYIILESTYGNKLHPLVASAAEDLLGHITETCIKKNGKLIIPAFSVGRTQELLYLLNRLDLENRLPDVPYYVDSPLSIHATEIVKHHPECFNNNVATLLKQDDDVFDFEGLSYTRSVEESIALGAKEEPCVIISASGMAEAGRVKHHIAQHIRDARNTILMVGYCEPQSLGGKLRAGETELSIFGRPFHRKADVAVMESLSAHGDYDDLCQWLSCQQAEAVKSIFLVHGEYEVQTEFAGRLLKKGYPDVVVPSLHETIDLS